MRLLVDFVPNHVAPDHPWLTEHPEYFVQGTADDLAREPGGFLQVGDAVIARGRDPYFPPWPDVAQLNAFAPGLREAADRHAHRHRRPGRRRALRHGDAAAQRGVRPHLGRAGRAPCRSTEYWTEVIEAVRAAHPDFLFMAEAYWDLEWPLQQLGFDYCYDKRLYDRLLHEGPAQRARAPAGRHRLPAPPGALPREPRRAPGRRRARPRGRTGGGRGCRHPARGHLWHEGQFEGWRVRLPVFLDRRPAEPVDDDLRRFYLALLAAPPARCAAGEWALCEAAGWPDDASLRPAAHLVLGRRRTALPRRRQRRRRRRPRRGSTLPWADLAGQAWRLDDLLSERGLRARRRRARHRGPVRQLPPWGVHVLAWSPVA